MSVSLWCSLQQSSATAVPTPPTELHRITDLLHHALLWKQNQLYTENTVTLLKNKKMAHDTEDQVWVKEDIWASVVYLSRDSLTERILKTWKMQKPELLGGKKYSWNSQM